MHPSYTHISVSKVICKILFANSPRRNWPTLRRVWSKHYVCICGTCGEREDTEDRKEKAKEALRIQNLLKLQEEAEREKARAEEKKRKAEIRRKEKRDEAKAYYAEKKFHFYKMHMLYKNIERHESKSNSPKHLPSCPIRNLVRTHKKYSKMNLSPQHCSP